MRMSDPTLEFIQVATVLKTRGNVGRQHRQNNIHQNLACRHGPCYSTVLICPGRPDYDVVVILRLHQSTLFSLKNFARYSMHVTVKTLLGQHYDFELRDDALTDDLKDLITAACGVPDYQQRLVHNKILVCNETLASQGVRDGTNISLALRIRSPGGYSKTIGDIEYSRQLPFDSRTESQEEMKTAKQRDWAEKGSLTKAC